MNKDIIEHISYEKGRSEGYRKGLLDGLTKSIILLRNLQRSDERCRSFKEVSDVLEQGMELIAQRIEANRDE